MNKVPPHSYGAKSLLAYCVRYNMADYLKEARHARKAGRPLARRACVEMALAIRADFRNSRVG